MLLIWIFNTIWILGFPSKVWLNRVNIESLEGPWDFLLQGIYLGWCRCSITDHIWDFVRIVRRDLLLGHVENVSHSFVNRLHIIRAILAVLLEHLRTNGRHFYNAGRSLAPHADKSTFALRLLLDLVLVTYIWGDTGACGRLGSLLLVGIRWTSRLGVQLIWCQYLWLLFGDLVKYVILVAFALLLF